MPLDPEWERRLLDMDAGPERVRYWRNLLREQSESLAPQPTTQYERDLVSKGKCPRCRGALDTGWECTDCGYDAMPIARETDKPTK